MSLPATPAPTRHLQIDFLYLDLETCTRCRATDATLLEAIQRTRPALDAAGEAASSPPGSGTVPASLRRYFAAAGAEDKAACCGEGVAAAGCGCQA
jgi:hypothetical protein